MRRVKFESFLKATEVALASSSWLLRMQEGNHQYLTRGTAELLDNELLPTASSDSIHIVSWLVSSSGGGPSRGRAQR
ncbi:hypothetical protein V1478_018615 [Vespula squamosa]|uniref:Uncharacterized protein n=1 Tax=Vespula squamosa TaxID=30214 RepID=A0ABD1ZT83_VESSQ